MNGTCPQSTFDNGTACVPCDPYCLSGPCKGPSQGDCETSFVIGNDIFYIVTATLGALFLITCICVLCLCLKLRSKNQGRVQNYSAATPTGDPETGHYDNRGYQDTPEGKSNIELAANQADNQRDQTTERDEVDTAMTENISQPKGAISNETEASVHDRDHEQPGTDQQDGAPNENGGKYKTWQSSKLTDTQSISPFRTLPKKTLPPLITHKLDNGKLKPADSEMSIVSPDSGYNSVAGNSTISNSDTLKRQLKQITVKDIPLSDEGTEEAPNNFLQDLTPADQPTKETSAMFDSEGGFLELKQHGVFLFVPPGALSDEKKLFMRILETRTTFRGKHTTPTIKLGPDGIQFNSPVVLSIQHGATDTASIQAEIQQLKSPWKHINGEDGSASFVDGNALRVLLMHFTGIRGTYDMSDDELETTADGQSEFAKHSHDESVATECVSQEMQQLSIDDVKQKDYRGARPKQCKLPGSTESVDLSDDLCKTLVELSVLADHFATNKVKLTCYVTPPGKEIKLDRSDHRLAIAATPRDHLVSKNERKMTCSLAYKKELRETECIRLDGVFKGGSAAHDFTLSYDHKEPSCDITFNQTGGEPITLVATFPPTAIHKAQVYPTEDDFLNWMLGEKNPKEAGYIPYYLWFDLVEFLEPVRPGKDYMAFASKLNITPDKARFLRDTNSSSMFNMKANTLLILFSLQMRKEDNSQMDALQTLATILRNIGQELAEEKVQEYIEHLSNKKCRNKHMESGYLSEASSLRESLE